MNRFSGGLDSKSERPSGRLLLAARSVDRRIIGPMDWPVPAPTAPGPLAVTIEVDPLSPHRLCRGIATWLHRQPSAARRHSRLSRMPQTGDLTTSQPSGAEL